MFVQCHILHVYNMHNILRAPNPGLNKIYIIIIIIIRSLDQKLGVYVIYIYTYYEYATNT